MTEQDQQTINTSSEPKRSRARGRIRQSLAAAIVLLAAVLTANVTPASASQTVFVNEGESIQAAIDDAVPGTTIIVKGDHTENLWISTDDITLQGRNATITMPADPSPAPEPCQPAPGVAVLICVAPIDTTFAAPPARHISGVNITGFTLNNPSYDAISIQFTDAVRVTDNTIPAPGCDGVFVIFGTMVQVNRNTVSDAGCSGLHVVASNDARVQRNVVTGSLGSGISIDDTSRVVVNDNTANGGCIGISVGDGADEGYGVRPEPFSGSVARISNNVTNGNNLTCPFGPDTLVGGTGIVVGGVSNITIQGNVASHNVIADESLTAAGIAILDLPNFDGSFSVGNIVKVINNTMEGNSSAAGPVDLLVGTAGMRVLVNGNSCHFAVPNATFCS